MKIDRHIWTETYTYGKRPTYKERDVKEGSETRLESMVLCFQRRFATHVKRNLLIWKETCIYEKRPIQCLWWNAFLVAEVHPILKEPYKYDMKPAYTKRDVWKRDQTYMQRDLHIWRETTRMQKDLHIWETTYTERWGAGVETQKNVRGEIGGWGRVPFNETYAPSLSTIYDGA